MVAAQERLREAQPWHPLTEREHRRRAAGCRGHDESRDRAPQLVVSPKTVSAHVEHILTKLGAGRRAEIAAWVTRLDD